MNKYFKYNYKKYIFIEHALIIPGSAMLDTRVLCECSALTLTCRLISLRTASVPFTLDVEVASTVRQVFVWLLSLLWRSLFKGGLFLASDSEGGCSLRRGLMFATGFFIGDVLLLRRMPPLPYSEDRKQSQNTWIFYLPANQKKAYWILPLSASTSRDC